MGSTAVSSRFLLPGLLRVLNWGHLILACLVLGVNFATLTPNYTDFTVYYHAAYGVRLFRAQQVWFMVNSALLGVLLYLSLTSIASEWIQQHWGLVVLAVVLAPPTYLCLQIGQLGIVMAVLLVAIYAMQARRSVGGLVLAVACVLKLFPALLGFYFFRRRAW